MQATKKNAQSVLAANVKKHLKQRDWSFRELGRRSKNTAMMISRIVRKHHMPSGDVLLRIAEAFDVSLDSLFQKNSRSRRKRA